MYPWIPAFPDRYKKKNLKSKTKKKTVSEYIQNISQSLHSFDSGAHTNKIKP